MAKLHKRDRSPELAASLMRCCQSDIRMMAECEFLSLAEIAAALASFLLELEGPDLPDMEENPYVKTKTKKKKKGGKIEIEYDYDAEDINPGVIDGEIDETKG